MRDHVLTTLRRQISIIDFPMVQPKTLPLARLFVAYIMSQTNSLIFSERRADQCVQEAVEVNRRVEETEATFRG